MRKGIKTNRGSLSLEAAVAFPIFIVFFALILFCIKVASVNIILTHAVDETAKQLAAAAYPIAMVNEFEDDAFSEGLEGGIPAFSDEVENVKGYLIEGSEDIFKKLLSGTLEEEHVEDNLKDVKNKIVADYISGFAKHLVNSTGEYYYDIKNDAAYQLTKAILKGFIQGSGIKEENLEFLLVKLPQSEVECQFRNEENDEAKSEIHRQIGLTPGKDDVALVVEYRTRIPFPYLGDRELVYQFTAVEKAWTKGGNGVYTVHPQSSMSEDSSEDIQYGEGGTPVEESYKKLKEETVYVTRTGKKYHKDGCRYLAKSKIPLKISEAGNKGYTPCKKCYGK